MTTMRAHQSLLDACETMDANITPVMERVRRSVAELIDGAEVAARSARRASTDKMKAVRPTTLAAPATKDLVEDAGDDDHELTGRFTALRQPA